MPRSRTLHAALAAGVLALVALHPAPVHAAAKPAHAKPPATAKPAAVEKAPFQRADMDTTCAPCRDFDQFANGGWYQHATMPPSYARYGSFEELRDHNQDILHGILEKLRAAPPADAHRRKLADYYSACLDSDAAEAAGAGPMQPLLTAIDGMKGAGDLGREVAWLHAHGVPGLFGFFANQDPRHSADEIAFASQGGLGLPDRDYYLKTDSASAATRDAYVAHMGRMFELLGESATDAAAHAGRVMAIETALAGASMTNVQRRDPIATYHKMPADSLGLLAPSLDWSAYFTGRSIHPAEVNVTQPEFFRALGRLIDATPVDDWKAYLRWKVVDDAAPLLSSKFVDEDFHFRQVLSGVKEMQPRWKRCTAATDRDLGELLGAEYVKVAFTPADKARMLTMVHNLEAALAERLKTLPWMSDPTRVQAEAKLAAYLNKIGYPNTWRDYTSLQVTRDSWYANRMAAAEFEAKRNLDKLGKPVDRGEWTMSPPTVNAYYSASLNSINFPAGILQPPFFDAHADDATNYGAIGAVIGHEMTHGFDDHGRQFDGAGDLRDWWTPQDAANYKERAQKVVEQFNGYTVNDTLHVNGRLTLGENIADLGGLAIAYAAMEKAYAHEPRTKIQGFTPEQRFFLGYARIWREIQRPEALRTQVLTNPHSPGHWRADGPLSNLKEFQDAWGCKAGDPMVRPDDVRARIW
ncbi:MAG TPA: M13 family metallopeptidase [Candidatus Eisenbacteria bacterium]|nr:M13 family metallopeptidase [Candidatus Eisenbacteria bacterium]